MKYTIDYSSINSEQVKRDRALADMQAYLSEYSYNIVATVAMAADIYHQLSFTASFAGVQGYPVAALWDETRAELHSMTQ